MKKKLTLLIILLISNYIFSQNFKGNITYQATIDKKINKEKIEKDAQMNDSQRNNFLKLVSKSQPVNFHLFFENNISFFQAEYDRRTKRRLGLLMNLTNFLSKDSYTFYTNLQSKAVLGQNYSVDKVVIMYDPVKWVLTQETKMIGKYKCYKATAVINKEQESYWAKYTKPIVAWYAPEIPVHFGIQNFVGLPGLTMELLIHTQNGQVHYKATKIELNSLGKNKIRELKGKQISEDDYLNLMKKMNKRRKK